MDKRFRVYFTSDTHGHVFPVNYARSGPEAAGLLNLSDRIRKDGNTLVLDGGDSLQGTPLTQFYLDHRAEWPLHPVAAAFNAMGLDYFTLGNHDFNFGYDALRQYLDAMDAVCLCANVEDLTGALPLRKWTVHTLENGLRVGLTGVVTDYVNVWEQPQNLDRLRVTDAFAAARDAREALRGRCDVCVCLYHGGFECDLETGRQLSASGENIACRIARELEFDLLLTGHQHIAVEGVRLGRSWAVQPPANAGVCLEIEGSVSGMGAEFASRFLPAGETHPGQPYGALLPLEQAVQHWLDQPVGCLTGEIPPEEKLDAALHGSRLVALFNRVQLEATGADFSCTSLGNDPVGLPTPVTMRHVTAAYLFANTLVVLEVTADVLRAALERCAAYFTLENGMPQVSQEFLQPKIEHYNYDFYAGLACTFDLRRPVGRRVIRLTRADGSALGQGPFRLCLSNYRATGTGGYDVLAQCPVLERGSVEVPALVADYIRRHSPVPTGEKGGLKVVW